MLLPPLPPSFEAALRDVRARRVELRLAAAERLAEPDLGREQEALEALLTLSQDRDARVRGACMLALGTMADGDGVLRRLVEGLDDEQAHVRERAVLALSELESERVAPILRRALWNEHAEVRFQAAVCFPQQPDAASEVDRLARLLDDADARVRKAAALSLAQLGDARGADQLSAALHDADLALEALDALGEIGAVAHADAVADIARRILVAPMLKAAAARALLRLGDARGVSALREVLRGFRSEARSYAVQVVAELRVSELVGELARLAKRPRGADAVGLVDALAAFAATQAQAREGLARLARRSDAAGEQARRRLSQLSGDPP